MEEAPYPTRVLSATCQSEAPRVKTTNHTTRKRAALKKGGPR